MHIFVLLITNLDLLCPVRNIYSETLDGINVREKLNQSLIDKYPTSNSLLLLYYLSQLVVVLGQMRDSQKLHTINLHMITTGYKAQHEKSVVWIAGYTGPK